jgi:DNA repair exonuclease SbcCD nuclease subunit
MNILHSADLHLGSSFASRSPEEAAYLRRELLNVPKKLADLARREQCQMMLLSGDLFDGSPNWESIDALRYALEDVAIPVFISPGNHDPIQTDSPYINRLWPSNVHIFTRPVITAVTVQELDCKVYGAGYHSMDCPGLLQDFQAEGMERYHIGIFHGDPTNTASPCCPITPEQIRESGLDYLALGHIHKGGSVRHGDTVCAWPGCPMGRGFDETGHKGALIVSLDGTAQIRPVFLETPSFFDIETTVDKLADYLDTEGSRDLYRITLTGDNTSPTVDELYSRYQDYPFLQIKDRRKPLSQLWAKMGSDSLEGTLFQILHQRFQNAEEADRDVIALAARITQKLLDGEEVVLP